MHAPCTRRQGSLLAGAACGLVLFVLLAFSATPARADGDPASDVLATQSLFLPQDAGVPVAQQLQLAALVREAAQAGYPIRVALIDSPADLGSITGLWRQPVSYAKFLGQELSLTYRGTLLVVMPNGFGVYDENRHVTQQPGTLTGVPVQPTGIGLATSTVQAVQRLAATAGHSLSVPRATAPGSAGGSDALPWVVFALGVVLIGTAWTASLRARPLGSRHEDARAA